MLVDDGIAFKVSRKECLLLIFVVDFNFFDHHYCLYDRIFLGGLGFGLQP